MSAHLLTKRIVFNSVLVTLLSVSPKALGWAEKPLDDIGLYALIEDVQENWEEYPGESKVESRSEERTLEMDEKILEVQAGWSGKGRFILKQIAEVNIMILVGIEHKSKIMISGQDCMVRVGFKPLINLWAYGHSYTIK